MQTEDTSEYVGKLVRLGWFRKHAPRPTGGKWDVTWHVIEDFTMTIAIDPENTYSAGEILVLDNGAMIYLLASDIEVINEN